MHRFLVVGVAALAALTLCGPGAAWTWPADGQVLRPFGMGGRPVRRRTASGNRRRRSRRVDDPRPRGRDRHVCRLSCRPTVAASRSRPTTGTRSRSSTSARSVSRRGRRSPRATRSARWDPVGRPSIRCRASTSASGASSDAEGYVDPLGLLPPRAVPVPTSSRPDSGPVGSAPSRQPVAPPTARRVSAAGRGAFAAGRAGRARRRPTCSGGVSGARGPARRRPDAGPALPGAASSGLRHRRHRQPAPLGTAGPGGPRGPGARRGDRLTAAGCRGRSNGRRRPARSVRPEHALRSPDATSRVGVGRPCCAGKIEDSLDLAPLRGARHADPRSRRRRGTLAVADRSPARPCGRHGRTSSAARAARRLPTRDGLRSRPSPSWRRRHRRARPRRGGSGYAVVPLGPIVAAFVLGCLVAVAGSRRAARRIDVDRALLPHDADLLRELDPAHRARVHDRGSGHLHAPPAAARS